MQVLAPFVPMVFGIPRKISDAQVSIEARIYQLSLSCEQQPSSLVLVCAELEVRHCLKYFEHPVFPEPRDRVIRRAGELLDDLFHAVNRIRIHNPFGDVCGGQLVIHDLFEGATRSRNSQFLDHKRLVIVTRLRAAIEGLPARWIGKGRRMVQMECEGRRR